MKKFLNNVKLKYPEMMEYIEENMKKVCKSEKDFYGGGILFCSFIF